MGSQCPYHIDGVPSCGADPRVVLPSYTSELASQETGVGVGPPWRVPGNRSSLSALLVSKSEDTDPIATLFAIMVCSFTHDWPAMTISGLLLIPNLDP